MKGAVVLKKCPGDNPCFLKQGILPRLTIPGYRFVKLFIDLKFVVIIACRVFLRFTENVLILYKTREYWNKAECAFFMIQALFRPVKLRNRIRSRWISSLNQA